MPFAAITLIQYILAFLLVFVLFPKLMFARTGEGFSEVFFADLSRMVLAVIAIGYLLVITKLFEFISVIIVFLVMVLRKYYFAKPDQLRRKTFKEIRAWLSDYFEGLVDLPATLLKKAKEKKNLSLTTGGSKVRFFAGIVLAVSAGGYMLFIRLYDSFINAAPAMSDAYVTLAWMKYINGRILFHDGIYPQGYYIFQAFIQKFSGLDPIYVLRFTGPLVSALIAFGIYFAVAKFLKCRYSGFLAAVAYGLFGNVFTGSWERQAASNSQEFGFLFIMPVIYFFYKYSRTLERKDLIIAASSLAVIGLTHALAFIYAVFGIIILAVALLLTDIGSFRKSLPGAALAVAMTGIAALIPAGIGFAMGKELHSASAEFAASAGSISGYPILMLSDYVALGCILLAFIMIFAGGKKETKTALLFLVLFGGGSFLVYYFGGQITGSLVIEARARELFSIASPIMIGTGFYAITSVFRKENIRLGLRLAAACVLTAVFTFIIRPAPIIPYKMEFNSYVEQYLRISGDFRPTEWLIVSQEEGYSLAYGRGWHLMTGDFLAGYSGPINVPHIFIFHEKEIYETYLEMKELEKQGERRANEIIRMGEWLDQYKETGGETELYYDDEYISVYHIVQEDAFEEVDERVLGPRT